MSLKIDKYQKIPFCEISRDAFYTYARVEYLLKMCEENQIKHMRCRTMGVLSSTNGGFHLKDIDLPLYKSEASIQVSMVYLKVPFKSTTMPQAVQIFGTFQWKNKPVIFANILQVLNIPLAIKLNDAIKSIALDHLVKHGNENHQQVFTKTDLNDRLTP